MALTYALNKTADNKLLFKRERSYVTTVVSIVGGLIFAFGALAIPLMALKILAVLGGIGFSIAAIYLPSLNDRFVLEQSTFELSDQSVTFEMTNGRSCQIPLSNVKEFVIDTEKRSPSAANSAGIHYLHHHINLKRDNEAIWTITTTTDANEANQIQQLLNGFILQTELVEFETSFTLSNKIEMEVSESPRIRWQDFKYELSIGRDKIRYTEYKQNEEKETTREFAIADFKCVRYSYSSAIKNKNWTIAIVFRSEPPSQLNLLFRDLNPVECLQLERWLHQTIQKKLSA